MQSVKYSAVISKIDNENTEKKKRKRNMKMNFNITLFIAQVIIYIMLPLKTSKKRMSKNRSGKSSMLKVLSCWLEESMNNFFSL